jgi:hypothetical protein
VAGAGDAESVRGYEGGKFHGLEFVSGQTHAQKWIRAVSWSRGSLSLSPRNREDSAVRSKSRDDEVIIGRLKDRGLGKSLSQPGSLRIIGSEEARAGGVDQVGRWQQKSAAPRLCDSLSARTLMLQTDWGRSRVPLFVCMYLYVHTT